MPREVFELTPPQLEWLIENQTLTGGEALHESSKMGCGVGSFGPSHSAPAGYSPQQEAMYYHQPPLQPPHPHMEGYPSIEYDGGGPVPLHDRDHYNRGMDSSEEELEVHYPSDQDRPEDPYPHRVGKLTWEQSFDNLKIYAEKNGVRAFSFQRNTALDPTRSLVLRLATLDLFSSVPSAALQCAALL